MEKARNDELYRALKEKDYPDDFCREIAYNQIRTDYTATRMLGYLYRTSNPRAEDVVDEMLAIFSDRDAVMQNLPGHTAVDHNMEFIPLTQFQKLLNFRFYKMKIVSSRKSGIYGHDQHVIY